MGRRKCEFPHQWRDCFLWRSSIIIINANQGLRFCSECFICEPVFDRRSLTPIALSMSSTDEACGF